MSLVQSTEPTGSVQLAQVIMPVYIDRRLQTIPTDPKCGLMIAGIIDITEGAANSLTYRLTAPNEFTGAAEVADNDAAPEESLVPTAVNITGTRYGLRAFVLDGPSERAVVNAGNAVIDGLKHAQEDRAHLSTLSLFTSITATSGTNASELDLAAWDTITSLFRSSNHDMLELWACFGAPAVRQLKTSLRNTASAIYSTAFGEAAARALANTNPGLGIAFDGFTLHESANVPVGDTTGITGAIGAGGPNDEENAGLVRVRYQLLRMEMQRDASRYGTWIVSGTVWGVGIAKQNNLRKYITRAS